MTNSVRDTLLILFLLLLDSIVSISLRKVDDIDDQGWQYFCYGNCTDIATPTTPGMFLQGGGTDIDAGFEFLISQSGGGNFLILRTAGDDSYNEYIYGLGKVQSVATLVITSTTGSNSQFVYNTIMEAEAVFLAGGDQSTYVSLWNNTLVKTAIETVRGNGVPIGGTSAGLHSLGFYMYTAAHGSVTSEEALENPYYYEITLGDNFLLVSSYLMNVIFDSHFYQRDRMGRSITFLARLIENYGPSNYIGIAMDEQTGLIVDSQGNGQVVNYAGRVSYEHCIYLLEPTQNPTECVPRRPLEFSNVKVTRIMYEQKLNLDTLVTDSTAVYYLTADNGKLDSSQPGNAIY